MKHTPFTPFFLELGAKMTQFAGYGMPLYISGMVEEHLAVRNNLGVFDVSHMGKIWLKGKDATKLLQILTSNDIHRITNGKVQYTCMLNKAGGIVDDLLVYKFNDEKYLIVVNAINAKKVLAWCKKNAEENNFYNNTLIKDETDTLAQLAVQGPNAMKVMQKLTNKPITEMKPFRFDTLNISGIANVILSTTGYTGSPGCEVYVKRDDAPHLWKEIFRAGAEFGVKPCGLGARDSLRIEAGMMLYGNDISEATSPLEAGLSWVVKLSENNNFNGKDDIEKQLQNGTAKKLIGFTMISNAIPRKGYAIQNSDNQSIGEVTSGTFSSFLAKKIGMGYVKTPHSKVGTQIYINIRNKMHEAKVVKLPFYKYKSVKLN